MQQKNCKGCPSNIDNNEKFNVISITYCLKYRTTIIGFNPISDCKNQSIEKWLYYLEP